MQSFSFCLLRHMSFLADKIRAKLFLGIGIRNACFFACFKATHHPNHIFGKVAHRLHPFFVLRRVLRCQPVHHIPVEPAVGICAIPKYLFSASSEAVVPPLLAIATAAPGLNLKFS